MSSPIKQPLNESNSNDNDSNDDSNFKNKRLVIHKLSLINFKSFAGKQIIGPFHKVRVFFVFTYLVLFIYPYFSHSPL